MRLGRVQVTAGYIVDLDDPDMVLEARDALYDDLMSVYKHDQLGFAIKSIPAPEASENDIPDFLMEKTYN